MYNKKTKYYSGKAVNKTPKAFEGYDDMSKGLMNVPDGVMKQAATGYNIDIVGAGTREGKKLRGKGKSGKALRRLKL